MGYLLGKNKLLTNVQDLGRGNCKGKKGQAQMYYVQGSSETVFRSTYQPYPLYIYIYIYIYKVRVRDIIMKCLMKSM
jgi:hypothetical protein